MTMGQVIKTNPSTGLNDNPLGEMDIPQGLTERKYFAALAMQGLLANSVFNNPKDQNGPITVSGLCGIAVIYADALVDRLNK